MARRRAYGLVALCALLVFVARSRYLSWSMTSPILAGHVQRDEDETLELRDYLHILRTQWLLIAFVTLLGITCAVVISLAETPKYEAQTKLYVSVHTDSQATGDMLQGANFAR